MKKSIKQYIDENAKARAQWTKEQAYEMNISTILASQLVDGLACLTTKTDGTNQAKFKSIFFANNKPAYITYTTDAKGRPAWCIKVRQKKDFSEDYIHYDQDAGLYIWSSNEGEPIKNLAELIETWEDEYKTLAYQTYAIKQLYEWGLLQDALIDLLGEEA